jgi:hypothetical protein
MLTRYHMQRSFPWNSLLQTLYNEQKWFPVKETKGSNFQEMCLTERQRISGVYM